MKRLSILFLSAILGLGVLGCEADDTNGDVIKTDQVQPCTAEADTVKASCEGYRTALCERHVSCSTYGDLNECYAWFDDLATGYGGCADAPTDPLDDTKQANYSVCICELPDANCNGLKDPGAEATIPACGQF